MLARLMLACKATSTFTCLIKLLIHLKRATLGFFCFAARLLCSPELLKCTCKRSANLLRKWIQLFIRFHPNRMTRILPSYWFCIDINTIRDIMYWMNSNGLPIVSFDTTKRTSLATPSFSVCESGNPPTSLYGHRSADGLFSCCKLSLRPQTVSNRGLCPKRGFLAPEYQTRESWYQSCWPIN